MRPMRLRAWIRATRPLAHGNIAPPILLGQALAFAVTDRFSLPLAGLAFGFGVLDHLAIVLANDYADREADAKNPSPTWLSGGSRVLVDGLLEPAALRRGAWIAGAALLAWSGLLGAWMERPALVGFALAALALLHAYSFAPLRLSYRGFGELLQGLGVGLVLPWMGFYAQTGRLGDAPLEAFAPLVLLGFVSNILTALPDLAGDRAAGKRTWPVRRGEAKARRDAIVLLGVGVLLITQVGPSLSPTLQGVALAPPALATLGALVWLRRGIGGDTNARAGGQAGSEAGGQADGKTDGGAARMRFVVLALGAITLAQLSWSAALILRS